MKFWHASKIQHPDSIREALGFSGEPAGFDLIKLYERAKIADGNFSRGDLRIAWKIANDPFYWPAFKRFQSLQSLAQAGFFDDRLEPGELHRRMDPQFLTTPLECIRQQVLDLELNGNIHKKSLVVLLTTGCFAPVHNGHIAMMEKAKAALEDKGYQVLGGFMSPSHDDYASTKGATEEERKISRQLTAAHRIDILNKVLADSSWLMADPWESRYAPTDINFTDTIQRLQNYINAHINSAAPIEIAYVFGADNIRFARTFADKGLCVAVPRPGFNDQLSVFLEKSGLNNHPRVIIAQSSDLNISSSKVRSGLVASHARLENDASYLKLLKGEARQPLQDEKTGVYLVRDDIAWATERWRNRVPPAALEKAAKNFRDGIVRAIENAFERSNAPGYPRKVDVVLLPVQEQIAEAEKIMSETPEWVINNDVITGGTHMSIGVSRRFNLSSAQLFSKTLVPRPGREDLKRILGRLPKGNYTIVDDDQATGSTMRMIEEQLPEGIMFKDKVALSRIVFERLYPDRPYAFWDIVDARDFLMGATSAGLVVQLFNGEVGRAPYMLPYTSLISRAKIPPDQEMAFTQEVLNLNKRFFSDIWADLRVEDTDPQFQKLMRSVGFGTRTQLADLCLWHQQQTFG